jgi:hypothetical protein
MVTVRHEHVHNFGDIFIHVTTTPAEGGDILERLDRIEAALRSLGARVTQGRILVQAALQELEAEVSRNTEVDESAKVLLQRLADLIEQSAGNPDAVRALAGRLRSSTDVLAEAIVAHTPADTGGGGNGGGNGGEPPPTS